MSEFLLRMHGDKFAPEIQDGDHLTARQQDTADDGQGCCFEIIDVDSGSYVAIANVDAEGRVTLDARR